FILTPATYRIAIRFGAVDRPGPRKVHLTNIPRLGGLAVIASGFIVAGLLYALPLSPVDRIADDLVLGLTLGLIPIFICSVADDLQAMRAFPKFMAHLAG